MKRLWLRFSRVALFLSAGVLAVATSTAQQTPTPFVIGEISEFESETLRETRRLIIGKPTSYESGEERYPVLYLLDGGGHFHHTTGITRFLATHARIPELLVVAITNTDRTRDLTPPSDVEQNVGGMPTQGGADNFLHFISEELVPWVDQNYRTIPHRIVVGHSLGGLFALHALVTKPEVFDAYIAISPSLQWNDQALIAEAESFFERTPELDASLYMTAGNEGGALLGGLHKLSGVLDEVAPTGFVWSCNVMPEESHGSVPHRSIYQGLEFVFPDYYLHDAMTTFDRGGLEGIRNFYTESGRKLGYDRRIPMDTLGELFGRLIQSDRLDEAAMLIEENPSIYSPPPPQALLIQAWGMLATGYARYDNEERAVEFYGKVLEVDPANEQARNALRALGVDAPVSETSRAP